MSIFLYYFEKNNPDATWQEFNTKYENITASFEVALAGSRSLQMDEVTMVIDDARTQAYVIHDGISSGKVLSDMKDATIDIQRGIILHFFSQQLNVKAINRYFIFHLVHQGIDNITINYSRLQQINIAALENLADTIEREVLYKLTL